MKALLGLIGFFISCANLNTSRELASQLPELKLYSRVIKNPQDYASTEEEDAVFSKLLAESERHFDITSDPEADEAKLYLTVSQLFEHAKANPKFVANLLTIEELTAVVHYTQRGFKNLNAALWNGNYGEDPVGLESKIVVLLSALNKLPASKGNVLRGELYSVHEKKDHAEALRRFESYKVNEEFVSKGFWSTTKGLRKESRGSFITNAFIVLKIKSKTARDIEMLSHHPEEEEWLFLPNTRFRVISKQKLAREKTAAHPYDYYYEIVLKELH